MTEQEMEDGIEPEVMPSTQLATIIKETKLESELAHEFTINFEEHFKMANEWSKKAKAIIVTNDNQTVLMEQARVARLFLRGKRLEIENFRKSKKEYYLRGGQAIDKVATFLKNMIEPIENHLDLQEHYVEYKKKAEDARLLAEAQAREELRLQEQAKKDAEALKIAQEENAKLIKERDERERINQEELKRVHQENEKALQVEREKLRKSEEEIRARKQAELIAEANRIREEQRAKSAGDSQKLIDYRTKLKLFLNEFPIIKDSKLIRIAEDAKSHLWLAHSELNQVNQEEEE